MEAFKLKTTFFESKMENSPYLHQQTINIKHHESSLSKHIKNVFIRFLFKAFRCRSIPISDPSLFYSQYGYVQYLQTYRAGGGRRPLLTTFSVRPWFHRTCSIRFASRKSFELVFKYLERRQFSMLTASLRLCCETFNF